MLYSWKDNRGKHISFETQCQEIDFIKIIDNVLKIKDKMKEVFLIILLIISTGILKGLDIVFSVIRYAAESIENAAEKSFDFIFNLIDKQIEIEIEKDLRKWTH